MDFGRITDPQAWKQAMANLLRRGEEVGTYIEQAPTKAGQAIIDAGQRQSALMDKATAEIAWANMHPSQEAQIMFVWVR